MKKHSQMPLYMLFIFLIINGIGCTSFYANQAKQTAASNNYDEWQRQWKKRLPLNEKEKFAFRSQGQEILASLMILKEKALKENSVSDAQKVARHLPQMYSWMKQCDAGFAGVVSDNPYLLNLGDARRSAPCLPAVVEARLALVLDDYDQAAQKCKDCPVENRTQEISAICEEVIGGVLKKMFRFVKEHGDTGDYIKQSVSIATVQQFVQTQKLDIASYPCPDDLSSQFSNYKELMANARQKNVAAMEKKARSWFVQRNYGDAKNAIVHALQIAFDADRPRLEDFLQTIIEEGVRFYRDEVKKAAGKGDFNSAEAFQIKASELDTNIDFNAELSKIRADKKEKQGQDFMTAANDCFRKKQFLSALDKASQAASFLSDPTPAKRLQTDASNAQGNWHVGQGNSFWQSGNLMAAEAEFEKAKKYLSNFQEAEDLRLKVRNEQGERLIEKGKRLWDIGDYDGAIEEFKSAADFLMNPQVAKTLMSQVKDAKGRHLLTMCRDERGRGNCKTAVGFAREARPLLFNPKEADYEEKVSKDCAMRKVVVILHNKTGDGSLTSDKSLFLGEIQNKIAANTGEFIQVLDANLLPSNGTPSDIARTVGAHYALVIQLSNLDYNKQIDRDGRASTVCTSTQDRNVFLGYDMYGRTVYTTVRDYSYASMTKYFDKADAKATVQAYLLDIKSGQSFLSKNEPVSGHWNQEAWRSETAAKYLRYCPACCLTNSQEVTSFLPQSYFNADRKLPAAGDLLMPKIQQTVLGWTKSYGTELDKFY